MGAKTFLKCLKTKKCYLELAKEQRNGNPDLSNNFNLHKGGGGTLLSKQDKLEYNELKIRAILIRGIRKQALFIMPERTQFKIDTFNLLYLGKLEEIEEYLKYNSVLF